MRESIRWNSVEKTRLSRRRLLRGSAVVAGGLAGAALIGCGDDDSEGTPTPIGTSPAGAPGDSEPRSGGTLRIGFFFDMHPRQSLLGNGGHGSQMAAWSTSADQYVYGRANGEVEPWLWESYEWVDEETLAVSLRPGVLFQDGTPFNAEAMKWSIETLKDPDLAPRYATFRGLLATVDVVDAISETEAVIRFNQPDGGFVLNMTASPGVPLSREQVENLGDDEFHAPRYTGPYTIMDSQADVGWRTPRFEQHWGYLPGLESWVDEYQWRVITSNETRAAAIQAGEVDAVIYSEADSNVVRLMDDDSLQTLLHDALPHALTINHVAPPLDDIRVRQALAHAIDRERVINTLFSGLGDPWFSLIHPDIPGAKDSDQYQFDVEESRRLLDAAGVNPSIVYALSGSPPTAIQNQEAALYQEMLNVAGFDVSIENVPTSGAVDLGENVPFIHAARIGQRADVFSSWTLRASYADSYLGFRSMNETDRPIQDEMHDLIFEGRAELDPDRRISIAHEVSDLYHGNVMGTVPICRTRGALTVGSNVGGLEHPEMGHPLGNSRPRFLWLRS